MWSSGVRMSCPTYLMTLKSLCWKGGSRCLIIAARPHSLPLTIAHWCALAQLPTTSTLTPSPAGCLWSLALLCLREGQAGHARAPLPLGAALPMTEGSWYIHTPVPSPMGGRTTRCLQHSIPECLPTPSHFPTPYWRVLGSLPKKTTCTQIVISASASKRAKTVSRYLMDTARN